MGKQSTKESLGSKAVLDLVVAWRVSAITAQLLHAELMLHSLFRIGVDLNENYLVGHNNVIGTRAHKNMRPDFPGKVLLPSPRWDGKTS